MNSPRSVATAFGQESVGDSRRKVKRDERDDLQHDHNVGRGASENLFRTDCKRDDIPFGGERWGRIHGFFDRGYAQVLTARFHYLTSDPGNARAAPFDHDQVDLGLRRYDMDEEIGLIVAKGVE